MTLEHNGLASKQIDAPQTIFHMPKEGQPRGAIPAIFRAAILRENTPNDVSVNLDAKGLGDDSRDAGTAKA
jgi:hypothetical protein